MKKHLMTLGIILLATCIAAPVFAGHGGGKAGHGKSGPCWQGEDAGETLSDEQKTELEALKKDFYADTAKIRHQLWAKTDELDILLDGSKPDMEKAKSLQAEISELRGQMALKRLERDVKAKAIAPEAALGRCGKAKWRHGRGHFKYAWGGHHRGAGHAPCWRD